MDDKRVKCEIGVQTPSVPNYLHLEIGPEGDRPTISVGDVGDDVLREIGRKWTEELISHAAKARAKRDEAHN